MFITLEGLDFCGKTTQAKLLVERLQRLMNGKGLNGSAVLFLREPGGTKISERVRKILLDKNHDEMTDVAELLLFSASRTQLVNEIIIPALQRGDVVVCDRYYDSTTAYQGYGRGLDLDTVQRINRFATSDTDPDITIFLDIPVAEIEPRKRQAGVSFDRMETSGMEFYERVRAGYQDLAKNHSGRFCVIDGMKPVQEVAKNIWRTVEPRFTTHSLHRG